MGLPWPIRPVARGRCPRGLANWLWVALFVHGVVAGFLMHQASRLRLQRTLKKPVSVTGVGYWSGLENRVEFKPAAAGAGVVFVRADLPDPVTIPVSVNCRIEASSRTNLSVGSARVEMVEHVLSALAGLDVDCCLVRVYGEEMPGLDGYETTRRIRAFPPPFPQPYIIALTAHATQGAVEKCIECGMDDYVSKPVQLKAFADALARGLPAHEEA